MNQVQTKKTSRIVEELDVYSQEKGVKVAVFTKNAAYLVSYPGTNNIRGREAELVLLQRMEKSHGAPDSQWMRSVRERLMSEGSNPDEWNQSRIVESAQHPVKAKLVTGKSACFFGEPTWTTTPIQFIWVM